MFFLERLNGKYSKYAPESNSWWGLCCCEPDRYTYIIYAGNDSGSNLTTTHGYTASDDSWENTGAYPTIRSSPYSGNFNDLSYSSGGGTTGLVAPSLRTDQFSFLTNVWVNKTDCIQPRTGCSGGMTYSDLLFTGLGFQSTVGPPALMDANYALTFEKYSTSSDSWSVSNSVTDNRSEAFLSSAGSLGWAVGGRKPIPSPDGTKYFTNDQMDMSTETWSVATALPLRRWRACSMALENKNYVVGGTVEYLPPPDPTSSVLDNTVVEYDPGTTAWTSKSNISGARESTAGRSDLINDVGYVYGGTGGTSTHRAYTPDTWTNKTNGLNNRQSHGAA